MKKAPDKYGLRPKDLPLILIVLIFAAFLLRVFALDFYIVPSASMEPGIYKGDYLLVSKLYYFIGCSRELPLLGTVFDSPPGIRIRDVKRGDVVAFHFPGRDENRNRKMIKRVIGIPGDTVVINEDRVFINGREFSAFSIKTIDMIKDMGPDSVTGLSNGKYRKIYLPREGESVSDPGLIKELASKEGRKCDLRSGNIVIDGKLITSYTAGQDYYFLMGDNRDRSCDSRSWGLLPGGHIIGKPLFVYWSVSPEGGAGVRYDRIGEWIR